MAIFIFSLWITILVQKFIFLAGAVFHPLLFLGVWLQQAVAAVGMTPETLSAVAAIVLSLVFAYVPKLNTWYAAQEEQTKKLVMLVALVLVAGGSFALACAGLIEDLFGLALTCDRAGAVGLIRAFILALVANQATFLIAPQSGAVKRIKALKSGKAGPGFAKG